MAYWLGRFCKKSLPNAETCQVEYQRCFTNIIYTNRTCAEASGEKPGVGAYDLVIEASP